jgi:excisionase family DNA binding protein
MAEYITIVEAARRVGLSDKTVRRAIHAGKLAARYPHPNKAKISASDLEAWYATLHIRPGETRERLEALETRVGQLESK